MWAADTSHLFAEKPVPKGCPARSSEHLVASSGLMKFTKKYPRFAFFLEFMGRYKTSYVSDIPQLSRICIAVPNLIAHAMFRIITVVICGSAACEALCKGRPENTCTWRALWGNGIIDGSGPSGLSSCFVSLHGPLPLSASLSILGALRYLEQKRLWAMMLAMRLPCRHSIE